MGDGSQIWVPLISHLPLGNTLHKLPPVVGGEKLSSLKLLSASSTHNPNFHYHHQLHLFQAIIFIFIIFIHCYQHLQYTRSTASTPTPSHTISIVTNFQLLHFHLPWGVSTLPASVSSLSGARPPELPLKPPECLSLLSPPGIETLKTSARAAVEQERC